MRFKESKRRLLTVLRSRVLLSFLLLLPPIAFSQTCTNYPATGGINKWPQGVVPFVFDANFPEDGKPAIRAAMDEWMDSGGAVAFVEKSNPDTSKPYMRIVLSSARNTSQVGPRIPTFTHLKGDMEVGGHSHVVHELGHALGFPHEQSRPDRDTYVQVVQSNIVPAEYPNNFAIVPWECWPPGTSSTPYDYYSIMHYDWCLGSVRGCSAGIQGMDDTMFATDTSVQYSMGNWIGDDSEGLSDGDKNRIQVVYGKAIWVDRNSDCTFENGTRSCEGFFDSSGPFTTITDAIDDAPANPNPSTTLMIRAGTYSRGTAGTLRIAKPMKLVAWESTVRIQ